MGDGEAGGVPRKRGPGRPRTESREPFEGYAATRPHVLASLNAFLSERKISIINATRKAGFEQHGKAMQQVAAAYGWPSLRLAMYTILDKAVEEAKVVAYNEVQQKAALSRRSALPRKGGAKYYQELLITYRIRAKDASTGKEALEWFRALQEIEKVLAAETRTEDEKGKTDSAIERLAETLEALKESAPDPEAGGISSEARVSAIIAQPEEDWVAPDFEPLRVLDAG